MGKPNILSETIIIVQPARKDEVKWRASAIIVWPDGSCDVGASGLDGDTKEAAEAAASQKAHDRWERIEHKGTLHKSHDAPGAVFLFLKP